MWFIQVQSFTGSMKRCEKDGDWNPGPSKHRYYDTDPITTMLWLLYKLIVLFSCLSFICPLYNKNGIHQKNVGIQSRVQWF